MTIRPNTHPVQDLIVPQHILVSVSDKTNLAILVNGILEANPAAHFYSTGGTGKEVVKILGPLSEKHYTSVEAFTGAPEMDGGLVKTLHPKIHAGLLAERNNPKHEQYLAAMDGVYFNVMVGNVYPFSETIKKPDCTPEQARGNIDIGGPAMIRAAAKNWHSIAVLTSPQQYQEFLARPTFQGGKISLITRFELAQEAFDMITGYDHHISMYMMQMEFDQAISDITIERGENKR